MIAATNPVSRLAPRTSSWERARIILHPSTTTFTAIPERVYRTPPMQLLTTFHHHRRRSLHIQAFFPTANRIQSS
jgi:hypothetical protein